MTLNIFTLAQVQYLLSKGVCLVDPRLSVRPSVHLYGNSRCEQIPNISYRFQYAILL